MKTVESLCALFLASSALAAIPERGELSLQSIEGARFQFSGPIGGRIEANTENWLLRAPQSNPGMVAMFALRDRAPTPQLVPWAGEFVGKYLISAIQGLRLTEDPRLFVQVSNVVSAFVATQAEDGYLGPFPKADRLLKNWDLWGHYHAIYALLLWHDYTGDHQALDAARKAGDLICHVYLNTGKRVFDAGDPEMNMSVLTGLAMLHRLTGEPRYLRMAREVEKDWERAGDYLRAGLDGREFFQSPRPRWESLHGLQGLLELWRISGEEKYREAFVHHWRSIRRWDRRNTGGFSSGEQATGNPYDPTAIETCCTVAWMALTLDYLKLTGDTLAADDLELATLNAGVGAQHPSGRWWTYNTPMDGVREASAHTIVFQSRAGTPELNCCSVNAPRVLGMLGDWSVMMARDAVIINNYLPGAASFTWKGRPVRVRFEHDYPQNRSQRIRIDTDIQEEFPVCFRIPGWSLHSRISASFAGVATNPLPGSFLEVRRRWTINDYLEVAFDFTPRAVPGGAQQVGKVSIYRGPLLLAWDQAYNNMDEHDLPVLDLAALKQIEEISPPDLRLPLVPAPWLAADAGTKPGATLRLVDFASAGSSGSRYRSWLKITPTLPAPTFTRYPRDGEKIPSGRIEFVWRGRADSNVTTRVEVASDPAFASLVAVTNCGWARRAVLHIPASLTGSDSNLWWRVVTSDGVTETIPDVPPAFFRVVADAPAQVVPAEVRLGPGGELVVHDLRRSQPPTFGVLLTTNLAARTPEGACLNHRDHRLVYPIPAWPEEAFTVAVRVRVDQPPEGRLGQIFSGWAGPMDDPLRLSLEHGKLYARIEAGGAFTTSGVPISIREWHHVAAVKEGSRLTLFLNGQPAGSCAAPELTTTAARDCALGANPHFTGDESLAATFAEFHFYGRALSAAEVRALAARR